MKTNGLTKIDVSALSKTYYKGNDPIEVSFEYLVSLWNVIRNVSVPLTPLHYRCEEVSDQYPTLQGITPEMAKVKFMVAAKKYNTANPERDIIDATRRKGPIVVSNNSITSTETTHVVKEGYIENYNAKDAQIRQVADIIAMYTTYNHKLKTITTVFAPEACRAVRVPYLDLVTVRQTLQVEELDAMEARSQIMFKLKHDKTYPFYWFFCMQIILRHDSMEKYRAAAPQNMIDWYLKQTKLNTEMRFSKYYIFCATGLDLYNMKLEEAWIYALRSDALRGIAKKRGLFTAGYYSFPLPAHYIRWIAEARDILSVMRERKIRAIETLDTNRMLIEILVHNGAVVVNRSMSTEEGKFVKKGKDKEVPPGVYARVPCSVSLYRALPLKPVLDNKTVKFEAVVPMVDGEIRSMYLHSVLPVCALYPSTRVAEGVVMTYYSSVEHAKPKVPQQQAMQKKIGELGVRFCRSITWRNAFVFTRVPYYIRDVYAEYFVAGIKYPRLKEDKEATMFTNSEIVDIDIAPRVILDSELGAVVNLRVATEKYEENDIVLDEDLYALLMERANVRDSSVFELHRELYRAVAGSQSVCLPLYELVRTNEKLFLRVMKDIERKTMKDVTILPEFGVVQFDYVKYRQKEAYYSPHHVDYESWESEGEENDEENDEDEEDDVEEEGKQQEVDREEESDEDENMFSHVVAPTSEVKVIKE